LQDVVLTRAGARLQAELRAMPMSEVVKKHHGHPIAAHNAARDPNVDRFMITDTSPALADAYTLSYVVDIPAATFKTIEKFENNELRDALEKLNLKPDWVKWPDRLPGEKNIPAGMTKADMKVVGVKHGATPEQDTYHVEVITNLPQYVNMVQKGLYNAETNGPEGLFANTIASDIEGHFKNGAPGRLRLQEALGLEVVNWPDYTPPLSDVPLQAKGRGGSMGGLLSSVRGWAL
jgi:hypothetical protein